MKTFIRRHLSVRLLALLFIVPLMAQAEDGANNTETLGSEDANRYAVFCITNKLDTPKKYRRRWGGEGWDTYTVEPGKTMRHSKRLESAGSTTFPTPYVRFDSDMSGSSFAIEYRLDAFLSPDGSCATAKKYQFEYDGSGRRFVDLKSVN